MKRVVIESPLAAPTLEGRERNKRYARLCMLDSLRRGEAPYASHLQFDQPGLLDDAKPDERELGIQAGFAWGEVAELVVVYTDLGVSSGMVRGVARALAAGTQVVHRKLGAEALSNVLKAAL
jgi:hypothetical protein